LEIILILLAITLIAACRPLKVDLSTVDYAPLVRNDWVISTPEEQGIDAKLVAKMYYDAADLNTLYSLLVIKNGYLVAEDYFNDGDVDQKDRLQSVTKSFTSALVGLAIEKECILGTDQKMLSFFPEIADHITDERKRGNKSATFAGNAFWISKRRG
jgi:CubicO group peptidase (beta-lactamase class C family)